MARVEIRLPNRRDKMSEVGAMVESFVRAQGGSGETVHDVGVVLDEVLSNIIAYGYGPEQAGEIVVRADIVDGRIVVEIEDGGQPFDPLSLPPPDLSAPLRERKVGGLGIHFIRHLMDEVAYARVGGTNRLRLSKQLPVTPTRRD
jgi:anti-sigma regulatory factor (Ser/Thr protein kinase)